MVGIYDMLRHEKDFANGAYNVPEYGSIDDPAQFKATLAYSPLPCRTPAARSSRSCCSPA
jgi:prolyl oligopeptidase